MEDPGLTGFFTLSIRKYFAANPQAEVPVDIAAVPAGAIAIVEERLRALIVTYFDIAGPMDLERFRTWYYQNGPCKRRQVVFESVVPRIWAEEVARRTGGKVVP